jgi:serine/threonine-protein kinase
MLENPGNKDLTGTTIDQRYLLLNIVGRGGNGVVYKARNLHLESLVAIKFLNRDCLRSESDIARFKNEAKIASTLHHENLVSTIACGVYKSEPYLVSQFIEGKTLAQWLSEKQTLTPQEALPIFSEVALALAEVHAHNIVHRDIKPSNILLEKNLDAWKAYLTDFGIAKFVADNAERQKLTTTGAVIGTPSFISPEQCSNQQPDERSDIYCLASVIYRSLIGHDVFEGETALVVMHKHLHEAPVISPHERRLIGNKLTKLLLCCLEKDPSKRVQSAREFHQRWQDSIKSTSNEPRMFSTTLCCLGLSLLIILSLGVAWFSKTHSQPPTNSNTNISKHHLKKFQARSVCHKSIEFEMPCHEIFSGA